MMECNIPHPEPERGRRQPSGARLGEPLGRQRRPCCTERSPFSYCISDAGDRVASTRNANNIVAIKYGSLIEGLMSYDSIADGFQLWVVRYHLSHPDQARFVQALQRLRIHCFGRLNYCAGCSSNRYSYDAVIIQTTCSQQRLKDVAVVTLLRSMLSCRVSLQLTLFGCPQLFKEYNC